MTLKYSLLLVVLILIACNTRQNTNNTGEIVPPAKQVKADANTGNMQPVFKEKENGNLNILGIWTDGSTENANFEIRKDSIYYVDQFATYKYSVKGDSINIFYPDWTFTGALSFTNDTLIIASEDGTTKFWKFNN